LPVRDRQAGVPQEVVFDNGLLKVDKLVAALGA